MEGKAVNKCSKNANEEESMNNDKMNRLLARRFDMAANYEMKGEEMYFPLRGSNGSVDIGWGTVFRARRVGAGFEPPSVGQPPSFFHPLPISIGDPPLGRFKVWLADFVPSFCAIEGKKLSGR